MRKIFVIISLLVVTLVLGVVLVPDILDKYYYTNAEKAESSGEYKKHLSYTRKQQNIKMQMLIIK